MKNNRTADIVTKNSSELEPSMFFVILGDLDHLDRVNTKNVGGTKMMSDNSTENIFRFMQLRAAKPMSDGEPDDQSVNYRTVLAMQFYYWY